tara:strand:+ start:184 stop:687 length:504 start_codon:yes stop_codon:yes gene_type:complete
MKKMIMLFILCFSFSFAGTVWVGAGMSAEVTLDISGYGSDTADMDNGGIEIGYTTMLKQDGKMGMGIGGSYHLAAMGEDDFDAQFLTLYGLGTYALSESMNAWFGLGLGLPQGDIDDADAGLAYSLGVMYNLNDDMMIGLGYTSNSCSDSDVDAMFTRMTLNFGYRM